jgi:hypothetical protein
MTGKSKVLNTHACKYYPTRPRIPQKHCYDNGYNNTHSQMLYHKDQNLLTANDHQPIKLESTLANYVDR